MIEAELKARLRDPQAVRDQLDARAAAEPAIYYDVYFDRPGGELEAAGEELRVRTIATPDGAARILLTFKGAAVDAASGSKPEYETTVGDADQADAILGGLGYVPVLDFPKECVNYRLRAGDRDLLATLVYVPSVAGTYLEVETLADRGDLDAALNAVRAVMADLGVSDAELTTELYTDVVRAARSGQR